MNAKPVVTKTKDRDLKRNGYKKKSILLERACKFLVPHIPKIFVDRDQAFISGCSIKTKTNETCNKAPNKKSHDSGLVTFVSHDNLTSLVSEKYLDHRGKRTYKGPKPILVK